MSMLSKQYSKPNLFRKFFGALSPYSWLLYITLACLVSTFYVQCLAAATSKSKLSADEPSRYGQNQGELAVEDRQHQWFFAKAVATSIGDLAIFAERLTLNSQSERVETLHSIYSSLIDIESELALMRRDLAHDHGVTDRLMSHLSPALTAAQRSALDAYMRRVITWHTKAATVIEQDAFLKNYYDHLLALNGVAVFLERFQHLLRSQNLLFDKRVNF